MVQALLLVLVIAVVDRVFGGKGGGKEFTALRQGDTGRNAVISLGNDPPQSFPTTRLVHTGAFVNTFCHAAHLRIGLQANSQPAGLTVIGKQK
jgi:hypothetical protein